MDISRCLFIYFRLFYKLLTVNNCSIKVAVDWIWTQVLQYWKQPRCQLCHNHCPDFDVLMFDVFRSPLARCQTNSLMESRLPKQQDDLKTYLLTYLHMTHTLHRQCDRMNWLFVQYLVIYNNENEPNSKIMLQN